MPVFVTKPQNRLNSDNPPEGGLLGKRTADQGTSRVKDSEIKAIMGSDCAERNRPVTMHRENIFLVRADWKIWGSQLVGCLPKQQQKRRGYIDGGLVTDCTPLPRALYRRGGGWGVPD